jgi:hypothetical protein
MAKKFLTQLDMSQLEILQLRLQNLTSDPATPGVVGQIWYDTVNNKVGVRGASSVTYKLVRDGGDLSAGSVLNTALATNPLARANHTGTQLAATISDLATTVQAYRLDQFAAPTAAVSLNNQKITTLADPTADTDAANKRYVDGVVASLSWKEEVVVATTTAGTLATSFANGQTVDGVTLATGNRILIKNQATGTENGIYTVNATGSPTRTTDSDSGAEIQGTAVFVASGTSNGGTRWVCNNTGTITVGGTALVFVQFSAGGTYTAGNGLTLTASDFNVGAGTGISVGADTVSIDTTITARYKTGLIGSGAATSITYNHALGNQFVHVQVYEVATLALVDCDIVLTDTNNVTLTFATAPATNAMRVVVIG